MSRKTRTAAVAVLVLLTSMSAGTAFAAPWTVVELRGTAQSLAVGTTQSLHTGDELAPGTIISSAPRSRVALAQDGNAIVLLGQSSIEIPEPTGDSGLVRIIQKFGRAIFDVTQRSTKHFQVETPYLIAGVKGTRFAITVDEAHGDLTVIDGVVEATTRAGEEASDILPGQSATVHGDTQGTISVTKTSAADARFWGQRTHLLDAVPAQIEEVETTKANGKDKTDGSGSNGNGNSGSNGNGNSGSSGNSNSGSNGNGNSGSNGNGNSGSNGNGNSGSNGNGNSGSNGNGKKQARVGAPCTPLTNHAPPGSVTAIYPASGANDCQPAQ